MIPYPTADYKKYCFAQAVNRMRRIQDIIDALDGIDSHATASRLTTSGISSRRSTTGCRGRRSAMTTVRPRPGKSGSGRERGHG